MLGFKLQQVLGHSRTDNPLSWSSIQLDGFSEGRQSVVLIFNAFQPFVNNSFRLSFQLISCYQYHINL